MGRFDIIWAREALENLDAIADYISERFSTAEVDRFLEQIREEEKILSIHPEAFRMINSEKQLRRTVVNKRTIIQYRVDKENKQVQIVSVFDARSNPDNRYL